MFKILQENQKGLEGIKISNTNTGEYISVIPRFGANINELVLKNNNKLYNVIDGNTTKTMFRNKNIFKNAKLFPFPNRIKNGRYCFEGKNFQLPLNYTEENNAAHGFVYDKKFLILSKFTDKNFAEVTFTYYYGGELEGYPFPFEIKLTYTLQNKNGLLCKTVVENKGETPMPIADGWHPFLNMNRKINHLFLKFNSKKIVLTDSSLVPTGEKIEYDNYKILKPIDKTIFDNCFLLSNENGKHKTELIDKDEKIKIILWQETGKGKYNYLQIYTPPDRMSIAIEPMTCSINSFNNKEGLIVLHPYEKFVGTYGIYLREL